MLTDETFIADKSRDAINAKFAPLYVDMETASTAHCGIDAFEKNCVQTSIVSIDVVTVLLKEIKSNLILGG